MKLGTLKEGGRDGTLVVVSSDLTWAATAPAIAGTLQEALDDWVHCRTPLRTIYRLLNDGKVPSAFRIDPLMLAAPLPRAYQRAGCSAYLNYVKLVRGVRGAEMPANSWMNPLIYQGNSDEMLGAVDPILIETEEWEADFEAELAVVVGDVPAGVGPEAASRSIQLLMLCNDITLRNLVPEELAKGFGFFQSKPQSAFSPVAVTPDEFDTAWDGYRLHRPLVTHLNGTLFGDPDCGVDMTFDFATLIAHATRSRCLGAGAIITSGTVSNRNPARGCSSIIEKRALETLKGAATTPYLKFGDRVRMEMFDPDGNSIFGAINQEVRRYRL